MLAAELGSLGQHSAADEEEVLEHIMAKKRKISSSVAKACKTVQDVCPHHLLSVSLSVPCCPSHPVLAGHDLHGSLLIMP